MLHLQERPAAEGLDSNLSSTSVANDVKTRRKSLLHSFLSSGRKSKMRKPVDSEERSDTDDKEDSYELDVSKFIEQERQMLHMNGIKKSCSALSGRRTDSSSFSDIGLEQQSIRTSRSPMLEQFLDNSPEQDNKKYGWSRKGRLLEEPQNERLEIDWRHLSTRSILSINSLKSSDSDLELLDCESLAMATTCSDDTCSSVELVWTRSKNTVKSGARLHRMDSESRRRSSMSFLKMRRPKSVGAIISPLMSTTGAFQWVANPLFSNDKSESDCGSADLRRCSSCDSTVPQQTMDIDKELDLDDLPAETNECKSGVKKRWSVSAVAKSPFTMCQDNFYLNQLKNNLDPKRLKTNVSQLKSHLGSKLSETGKRASILADQLLTSIKDTTRELVVIDSEVEKCDKEDSFACAPQPVDSVDTKNQQQFSLIFLHRQHQNGLPVITRQPQTIVGQFATGAKSETKTHSQSSSSSSNTSTKPQNPLHAHQNRNAKPEAKIIINKEEQQKSDHGFHSDTVSQSNLTKPTYCVSESGTNLNVRKIRRRSQVNKALPSDDEDGDDFMEREYLKVMSDVGVSMRVRRRNLRYWRRNKDNFRPSVSI